MTRRRRGNGSLWIGGAIVAVLVAAAIGAPWLAPYGPTDIFPDHAIASHNVHR